MVPQDSFKRSIEDINEKYSDVYINGEVLLFSIGLKIDDVIIVTSDPVFMISDNTWLNARIETVGTVNWNEITAFRILKKSFKENEKWCTRDGRIVTIVSVNTGVESRPIKADWEGDKILYDRNGRHMYPIEHDIDLISPIIFMNPRQVVESS